jgi:L-amino acid N-acyltransferase YncA
MELVRAATEQDAGAIAHVHVQSWLSTYAGIVPAEYLATLNEAERVPQWRAEIARGVLVYVAEADGEVVGFICGGRIREPLEAYDAELFAIYLLERAQRRGLGSALVRRLAESLLAEGFVGMVVWALETNSAGLFYEKAGAHRVGAKEIEIGGVGLLAVAFGWPRLDAIEGLSGA